MPVNDAKFALEMIVQEDAARNVSLVWVADPAIFSADAVTERLIGAIADDLSSDWPGYCLAVATGTGLVLQQAAFGSGRLATATTAMVVCGRSCLTQIA